MEKGIALAEGWVPGNLRQFIRASKQTMDYCVAWDHPSTEAYKTGAPLCPVLLNALQSPHCIVSLCIILITL